MKTKSTVMLFKAEQLDAVAGTFEGYAAVIGNLDNNGDIIQAGAFDETVANFKASGKKIPLLDQHDRTSPIGAITDMWVDAKGLYVKAALLLELQAGKDAYIVLKAGLYSMSIGYLLKRGDYEETEEGTWLLKKVTIKEVSLVTFPANEEAIITHVKSEDVNTIRDLERCLHTDAGYSRQVSKTIASQFIEKTQRDAALLNPDETQVDSEEVAKLKSITESLNKLL